MKPIYTETFDQHIQRFVNVVEGKISISNVRDEIYSYFSEIPLLKDMKEIQHIDYNNIIGNSGTDKDLIKFTELARFNRQHLHHKNLLKQQLSGQLNLYDHHTVTKFAKLLNSYQYGREKNGSKVILFKNDRWESLYILIEDGIIKHSQYYLNYNDHECTRLSSDIMYYDNTATSGYIICGSSRDSCLDGIYSSELEDSLFLCYKLNNTLRFFIDSPCSTNENKGMFIEELYRFHKLRIGVAQLAENLIIGGMNIPIANIILGYL
jgi:hypothetical protein